jgi:hypothetical protein
VCEIEGSAEVFVVEECAILGLRVGSAGWEIVGICGECVEGARSGLVHGCLLSGEKCAGSCRLLGVASGAQSVGLLGG